MQLCYRIAAVAVEAQVAARLLQPPPVPLQLLLLLLLLRADNTPSLAPALLRLTVPATVVASRARELPHLRAPGLAPLVTK